MTIRVYFSLLLVVSLLFACGNRRRTASGEKIKNYPTKVILDSLKENQFDYEWLRTKGNAKIHFKEEKQSVKVNFRVRKDSAIWNNISKSSIQILTSILSQDSVKFLLKMPKKQYFLGDYQYINKLFNIELDYMIFQDFVSGNAIGFDYEGKYKSDIDSGMYILSTGKSKRIDKILNKGKNTKKELLYRCWIDPETFKCAKVEVNLLSEETTLEVVFSDWLEVEGQLFPVQSEINVTTPYDTLSMELKYSNRIKVNDPQTFPFKITDAYEEFKLDDTE